MTRQLKPILHARDHLPGGADPLILFPEGDITDKILATSPAAFWKLDETTGTVAHDSSGNGHDLEALAGHTPPVWGQPAGPPGSTTAEWVDDSTRVSSAGAGMADFTDDFTAGVWVNLLVVDDAFAPLEIMGQGKSFHTSTGWAIIANTAGTDTTFWVDAGGSVVIHGDHLLDADTWYMVAVVRDTGTWKLYVDGLLQTETSTLDPGSGYGSDTWLGNDASTGHISYLHDALLSYAFIVDRAMSGAELLDFTNTALEGAAGDGDLVLGVTDDGSLGWVQPKVDVTVNGDPAPATAPVPAPPPTPGPPPSGGVDGLAWMADQPFVWGGTTFSVEPNRWTTIPFTNVTMVRYSNVTGKPSTWNTEIDPSDPLAGGWVDPAFPHAITIPHDMSWFTQMPDPSEGVFGWMQVCLFIEEPAVGLHSSYRQIRIFETTNQKAVIAYGQFRDLASFAHGGLSISRDPDAAGWTPPPDGTQTFAEGDEGGLDDGGHDKVMIIPNSEYGGKDYGFVWLPRNIHGNPMLTAGMRLVAQVWHDAPSALTFDAGGTLASFGTPAHAPYRPHFCVFQSCPRSWGSPWSDWPTYP